MAETTADVRRDIEMTRERMSDTLAQLEQKLNVMQVVRDNPWPALALAFGAGVALAGSRADVKAAAATVQATGGASTKVGAVLDDLAASVITGVSSAFQERVDGWVNDLKQAIGAPTTPARAAASDGGGTRAPEPSGHAAHTPSPTHAGAVSRTGEGTPAAQSAVDQPGRQVVGLDTDTRESAIAANNPPRA